MRRSFTRYFRLVFFPVLLVLASCSDPEAVVRGRVKASNVDALRRESGRLNRDFFAVPGLDFFAVKQAIWPKTFRELKPLRVTVYKDGAALAMGGDAGTNEWGVFVVPPGLTHTPPPTRTIRYRTIGEGVFFYSNIP